MDFIWSSQQLLDLLSHGDPDVQGWAARRLLRLYPRVACRETAALLASPNEAVQLAVLDYLLDHKDERLLPRIRELFVSGTERSAVAAVNLAGAWRAAEAVDWVKERILRKELLSRKLIDAMIATLGLIPGGEAYRLLKATEGGVKSRGARFFWLYYKALVQHRRVRDIDTLVEVIGDRKAAERIRHHALEILLGEVDPTLRVSNVYFGNRDWVKEHLQRRSELLSRYGTGGQWRDLPARIVEAVQAMDGDSLGQCLRRCEPAVGEPGRRDRWLLVLAAKCRERLGDVSVPDDNRYRFAVVMAAALLAYLRSRYGPGSNASGAATNIVKFTLLWDGYVDLDGDLWLECKSRFSAEPATELIDFLTGDRILAACGPAVMMLLADLGRVEAVLEALGRIPETADPDFSAVLRQALLRMGPALVPGLLGMVDDRRDTIRSIVASVLSRYPVSDAMYTVVKLFTGVYETDPEEALALMTRTGARQFIPFLEREYRPGEVDLAAAYVFLCRLNKVEGTKLRSARRDLKLMHSRSKRSKKEASSPLEDFPSSLTLSLSCNRCGKRYHYEVSRIYQHPPAPKELVEGAADESLLYRDGLVLADDLQCKNCGTWNDLSLTPDALMVLSQEKLRLNLCAKADIAIPSRYPIQAVSIESKDGREISLLEIERDLQNDVVHHPQRVSAHLALAKFYEYVKRMDSARQAYVTALNLNPASLEAMAGLARLAHVWGKHQEAFEWIERCYEHLDRGQLFLVESATRFKKAVREHRRQFAGLAGRKLADQQVSIRFRAERTIYPKNQPCPCGSGKKYKLCCMKMQKELSGKEVGR